MHLNISSLPYHFDELSELPNDLTIKFKIIGITESRLISEKFPLTDINLRNYEVEHMSGKANKGGALLYISNELHYKVRNNLQIHKDKKLESIFVEVISKSQKMWLLVAFINTQIFQSQNLMSVICSPFLTNYLLKTKTLS